MYLFSIGNFGPIYYKSINTYIEIGIHIRPQKSGFFHEPGLSPSFTIESIWFIIQKNRVILGLNIMGNILNDEHAHDGLGHPGLEFYKLIINEYQSERGHQPRPDPWFASPWSSLLSSLRARGPSLEKKKFYKFINSLIVSMKLKMSIFIFIFILDFFRRDKNFFSRLKNFYIIMNFFSTVKNFMNL